MKKLTLLLLLFTASLNGQNHVSELYDEIPGLESKVVDWQDRGMVELKYIPDFGRKNTPAFLVRFEDFIFQDSIYQALEVWSYTYDFSGGGGSQRYWWQIFCRSRQTLRCPDKSNFTNAPFLDFGEQSQGTQNKGQNSDDLYTFTGVGVSSIKWYINQSIRHDGVQLLDTVFTLHMTVADSLQDKIERVSNKKGVTFTIIKSN